MSYAEDLFKALDRAVEEAMGRGPAALLFSGGLDSGVLAGLAKRHGAPRLYTVGVEGCHDLRMSEEAARALDLPWTPLIMTPDDVVAAAREMLAISPIDNPVTLSFELPLQMIASRVEEEVLVSGQGADELFGGYNRYLEMSPADLEVNLARDIGHVLTEGAALDRVIAGRYGKSMAYPFLDPEVRRVASGIPVTEKIRGGVRKAPLRDVSSMLGLEIIASREKKAAQYGSGFMKVLKGRARKDGLSLKDYMGTLDHKENS